MFFRLGGTRAEASKRVEQRGRSDEFPNRAAVAGGLDLRIYLLASSRCQMRIVPLSGSK